MTHSTVVNDFRIPFLSVVSYLKTLLKIHIFIYMYKFHSSSVKPFGVLKQLAKMCIMY